SEEEGVPGGARLQIGDQSRRLNVRQVVTCRDERAHRVVVERAQRQPLRARLAREQGEERGERVVTRHLVASVGGDEKDGERRERAGEDAQQVERGRVGPVEVVQQ